MTDHLLLLAVAAALNKPLQPEIAGRHRDDDIRHCFADNSLIQVTLGWASTHTLTSVIPSLVAWLNEQQPQGYVFKVADDLGQRGLLK